MSGGDESDDAHEIDAPQWQRSIYAKEISGFESAARRRLGELVSLLVEPSNRPKIGGACALASYASLAVFVAEPRFAGRVFPSRDVTGALVATAVAGSAAWLWHRPHLQPVYPQLRAQWAVVGGTLYVLGSVLLWAMIRSAVGRRPYLNVALGVSTGLLITRSAIAYFRMHDFDDADGIDLTGEPSSHWFHANAQSPSP